MFGQERFDKQASWKSVKQQPIDDRIICINKANKTMFRS